MSSVESGAGTMVQRPRLMPMSRSAALRLSYLAVTAGIVGTVGFSASTIGLPTALYLALVADGILRAGSPVLGPVVRHGPRTVPKVALSFDDGPDPAVTPAVLDALARHNARATFFVIGRSLAAAPQVARRLVAEGHELGNHSWQHSRWHGFFGPRRHAREILTTTYAICALNGERGQPLFRPPLGLKSPPLFQVLRQHDMRMVAWSLHSRDTHWTEPARIAERVLQRVRPGDIVLLHDGHDLPGRHRYSCAAATSLILQGLAERRLQPVTVSELLGTSAR